MFTLLSFTPFQPTPGLAFWTLVIFLIFLYLMKKYAVGPITEALSNRETEIANAVDQAKRELIQRYDFKGTPASIELIDDKTIIMIKGDDYQLDVILEMLRGKLGKRGVSQNTLDLSAKKEEGKASIHFQKAIA